MKQIEFILIVAACITVLQYLWITLWFIVALYYNRDYTILTVLIPTGVHQFSAIVLINATYYIRLEIDSKHQKGASEAQIATWRGVMAFILTIGVLVVLRVYASMVSVDPVVNQIIKSVCLGFMVLNTLIAIWVIWATWHLKTLRKRHFAATRSVTKGHGLFNKGPQKDV